jgi:hypothetical protein
MWHRDMAVAGTRQGGCRCFGHPAQRVQLRAACLSGPSSSPGSSSRFLPACLQVTIKLESGLSWDDFPVVTLWCEEIFADFGHVELQSGEHEQESS